MDQSQHTTEARLELDDGASMKEVYGTGRGFYKSLVAAASCAYPRQDDGSWMEKLRFLTPMGRDRISASPDPNEKRRHCRCFRHGCKPFTGTETHRLRLTSFKEMVDCLHYVAVSYCWSSVRAESGPWRDKCFEIVTPYGCRPNRAPYQLIKRAIDYAAYRRLPFIWIDQECIEQDDEVEKTAIVDEMDRIYRKAERVIAVTTVTTEDPECWRALTGLSAMGIAGAPIHADVSVQLGEQLAADPWFHRAWTWQENMRAARVLDILIPLPKWINQFHRRNRPRLLGDSIITSQQELDTLVTWTRDLEKDARDALLSGLAEYKKKDNGPYDDLSRHRLSSFDAVRSLAGKDLTVHSDRLDIIANIASYAVRLNHPAAQKQRLNVGTCVFTQALLNGDMSLSLAYRQFLDPRDESPRLLLDVPDHTSLTFLILSSRVEIVDWIQMDTSQMFRCRTLPLSIEPQGFRMRGQLWSRAIMFDFPSLVRRVGSIDLESSQDMCSGNGSDICHSEGCTASLRLILRGLEAYHSNATAVLAFLASLTRRGRLLTPKDNVFQSFRSARQITNHLIGEPPNQEQRMSYFNGWSSRRTGCYLRDLLTSARVHVYAPQGSRTGPFVLWNDQGLHASDHFFTATRVLVDGEDSAEHLVAWTVDAVVEGSNGTELVLHDHFLRKIPTKQDSLLSPYAQAIWTEENWGLRVPDEDQKEYLLRFYHDEGSSWTGSSSFP